MKQFQAGDVGRWQGPRPRWRGRDESGWPDVVPMTADVDCDVACDVRSTGHSERPVASEADAVELYERFLHRAEGSRVGVFRGSRDRGRPHDQPIGSTCRPLGSIGPDHR